MCLGVTFHCGAYIVSFAVCYHKKSFGLCVLYCHAKRPDTLPAVKLIIRTLRFDSGHNIAKRVYKPDIKLINCLSRSLQSIAVCGTGAFDYIIRNIFKFRVKTRDNRAVFFNNGVNQSVEGHLKHLNLCKLFCR